MTRYQDVRLSKHFTLQDMMNNRDNWSRGNPLPLDTTVTDENIEMGIQLCENLLEPLIERYGPCSIAAGLCFNVQGPHNWLHREGAAVDAAFHDWVGQDKAPIKLVEDLIVNGQEFERLITYAGSEYICMAWSASRRFALYENVRKPGDAKPFFNSICRHPGEFRKLTPQFQARPDWRRAPNEVVYHTQRSLRPQHVRLSRYLTLLDVCRSEAGLKSGVNWVLPIQAAGQTYVGRMFGEILDPIIERLGRVSITQGCMPPQLAQRCGQNVANYTWTGQHHAIRFLLPQGAEPSTAIDILADHPAIVDIRPTDHPSEAIEIGITITPFDPKTTWSGGYKYGYYSGEVPPHLEGLV